MPHKHTQSPDLSPDRSASSHGARAEVRARSRYNALDDMRRAGNSERKAKRAVAIFACVFAVAVAATAWFASSQAPAHLTSDASQQTLDVSDSLNPTSGKLAGSEESVDEQGIVHGVTPEGVSYTVAGRGQSGITPGKVSLAAVGDVMWTSMAERVLAGTHAESGAEYDYSGYYSKVQYLLDEADLRFANLEAPCSGGDVQFYPEFNAPDTIVEGLAGAGFNLVSFANNHSFDQGRDALLRTLGLLEGYPQIVVGGSYADQSDRDTVHMIERNGITFAFLSYTYGSNTYGSASGFPDSYTLCGFDSDAITADVQRAQKVADAVIVGMHWGTEYSTEITDEQRSYAQLLADLGVDLVLGSHAHILQSVEFVEGQGGNSTPVVYGLSDFVSGWTVTDSILSGVFTCDFTMGADGEVSVDNLVFYPAIEWSDGSEQTTVRLLRDMTDEEIDANVRTEDCDDDSAYLKSFVEALGMQCAVEM